MSDNESKKSIEPRRRSLTSMTLTWLAERMRKTERLKNAVEEGAYRVNSEELAKSIVIKSPQGLGL